MIGRMPYIEVNDCLLKGNLMKIYAVLVDALDEPEAPLGLTKSVVAEVLEMHPPNAWHFLKELVRDGLVEETTAPPTKRGMPPKYYKAKYPISRRGVYLTHA